MELQAGRIEVGPRRGEHYQLTVVKLHVGNGNQRLMPTAIVPAQIALLGTTGTEHGEHAFNITSGVILLIHLYFTAEEIRWRHLAGITDHDNLAAT